MKKKKKTIEELSEKKIEIDNKRIEIEENFNGSSLKDSECSKSFKQLQKELLDDNEDLEEMSKIDD
jgi:hypothetical protein